MNKEKISDMQGISLLILFITGSAVLFNLGVDAQKDAWIAIILAILLALPVVTLYARILSLFPEMDLFDILQYSFGKVLGKIISILYIWFAFHLGALVLNDFGEFPTIVSLPETPKIIVMIPICLLCWWAIKEGIEVLGRCGVIFLWIIIVLAVLGIILASPKMNINNIQPSFVNGIKPILNGAYGVFSFPFGETILFCGVFSVLKHKNSPYNVYLIGLAVGGAIIFAIALSTFLVVGLGEYESIIFPTYSAAGRISIGTALQRIEIIVSIGFFVGGFTKICICLLFACKGIKKVFNFKDHNFIITPCALLLLDLSYLLHENILIVGEWTVGVWRYYSLPFEVIVPIIIWMIIELKRKRARSGFSL